MKGRFWAVESGRGGAYKQGPVKLGSIGGWAGARLSVRTDNHTRHGMTDGRCNLKLPICTQPIMLTADKGYAALNLGAPCRLHPP